MSPNNNLTRRNFIGTVGATGVTLAVTGCLEQSGDENMENPDGDALDSAGTPPTENIEEFHIMEIEFTENSEFEIRFENEGDQDADLGNYDVVFDLFGSSGQYVGTETGDPVTGATTIDAGAYNKITFTAGIGMADITSFDARVVCNGTPEAVFCST